MRRSNDFTFRKGELYSSLFYFRFIYPKIKIMPLVKFSALVSGMSGKAQGSVFATNRSGAYFRNNTGKIKPQTAKNSKQRSLFTAVSQAWRELDNDEQAAWNAAAPNFPRVNRFGDPVVPSGYNVFMRLNGTRAVIGLPIMSTPPLPRELPSPGAVTIDYPELFQFNPQFAAATYSQRDSNANVKFASAGVYDALQVNSGQTLSFRINPAASVTGRGRLTRPMVIFQAYNGSDLGIGFGLTDASATQFNATIQMKVTGGTWTVTALLSNTLLTSDVHFALFLDSSDALDSKIYVNGVAAATTTGSTGTPVTLNLTADFVFGEPATGVASHFLVSDFRVFSGDLSTENALLVSQGYLLGSEVAAVGFETKTGQTFPNATVEGSTYDFSVTLPDAGADNLVPHSALLIPQFQIDVENEGLEGVHLNIYATPPTSTGRTGTVNGYRLLGSFPWETETSFNVAAELGELYGNIPPASQINFKVEVFDTTTGVVIGPALAPPRKKPRFKAGAEMGAGVS
jgi:hypothetical protein